MICYQIQQGEHPCVARRLNINFLAHSASFLKTTLISGGLLMSMLLYGAARLLGNQKDSKIEVLKYWQELERIHHLCLLPEMPTKEYLEESLSRLWNSQEWIRFSLVGLANDKCGTSDHLLLQAAQKGQEIRTNQPSLPAEKIWTRVPQWRFLFFMFWHCLLIEGFLVIEHTSGDSATIEDQKRVSLTEALSELWSNYCWDMSCEDPALYHFDLSQLPR